MIKPETLDFPPLHCATDPTLGDYYQDLSHAITLIESNYYVGKGRYCGGCDSRGIPMVEIDGQGAFPLAVTTAQYALANITAFRRGDGERGPRARNQLDWLVGTQEREGDWAGCWLIRYDNPKYGWLRTPWTGALSSGNAISALLRGWELFGQEDYRASAEAAYSALHTHREHGQLFDEARGELWYEEYPANPAIHVLNGHIYTLLGVLDYARVSGDSQAEQRWRRAAATALAHLDEFDLGYWSAYDMRWREPAGVHYQKNVHVPQLRILARLTEDERFAVVADRWERYLESRLCRAR